MSRPRKLPRPYSLWCNCTQLTPKEAAILEDPLDEALEISYRTLTEKVSIEHLREIFGQIYKIGSGGWADLTLRRAWGVKYLRLQVWRRWVYVVEQSRIEYFFTLDGRTPFRRE